MSVATLYCQKEKNTSAFGPKHNSKIDKLGTIYWPFDSHQETSNPKFSETLTTKVKVFTKIQKTL